MKAVLLMSHGSRFQKTKEEVLELLGKIARQCDYDIYEVAFLELESPDIPQGIGMCVSKGATEVVVLLNFLNSGRHVDEDIPRILEETKQQHPHVKIKMTKPLGQTSHIADVFSKILQETV